MESCAACGGTAADTAPENAAGWDGAPKSKPDDDAAATGAGAGGPKSNEDDDDAEGAGAATGICAGAPKLKSEDAGAAAATVGATLGRLELKSVTNEPNGSPPPPAATIAGAEGAFVGVNCCCGCCANAGCNTAVGAAGGAEKSKPSDAVGGPNSKPLVVCAG